MSDESQHASDSPNIKKLREISNHLVDPDVAVRIFEELPDAVIVIDDKGDIMLVNRQAELLFHYARTEMFDKPIDSFIVEEAPDGAVGYFKTFFTNPSVRPEPPKWPMKITNKAGLVLGVTVMLSPIVTGHGLIALAIVRGMTI